MTAEAALRELEGLRALARALVRSEADADDLLQDAAVATLEHPPDGGRALKPWLVTVLRNRRRMAARAAARARAREEEVARVEAPAELPDTMLDRARGLARLASALVALDEPFRTVVIRHYLDGQTAAQIARALDVPAGTVRWRLMTGRERLRAVLAEADPRWRRLLVPLLPGVVVKTKTSIVAAIVVVLLLAAGALVFVLGTGDEERARREPTAAVAVASGSTRAAIGPLRGPGSAAVEEVREPSPGQGRARVEIVEGPGAVAGRVVNWSTGDGVTGAELTFTGDGGAITVRSRDGGGFELAPGAPGRFALTAVSAPGFLPYAPELLHSNVHVELTKDRVIRGITVFLFPAIDYRGRVVDRNGAPVAGARVRLLGTPAGEQAIEKLETEWTSGRDGTFTFHAADDAVLEAVKGAARGWARLDGNVAVSHEMTIAIAEVPPHDAVITGRTLDAANAPVADVLVRASPRERGRLDASARATAFAVSAADGTFTLEGLDREVYDLAAQIEGRAPATRKGVTGGTRGVTLVVDAGAVLAGVTVDGDGAPVPAYTLLVRRVEGAGRELVLARSIVDASGRFEVRIAPGDYELIAAASGWAPSAPTTASAGDSKLRLVVSAGATLRGTVIASDGGSVGYARVMREAQGGGASAQPANAGTVTRGDGSFELTGIPPGPLSITVGAAGFHPRIEAGMTASDGAVIGPIAVTLQRLAPGEQPQLELVGIGAALTADGDTLQVQRVFPDSGAAAAGIVAGDRILAVDGVPVAQVGLERSIAKIRGVAGTTISITLRRGETSVQLVVERRKLRT